MSLFDSIVKGAAEQLLGGNAGNNDLLGAAAKLINSQDVGGLAGLAKLFTQKGEGDAMASWISTGKNLPISPDAIMKVLGSGRIQELAGSLGLSSADVQKGLASTLPQLVDKLTPDGKLPSNKDASDMLGQLAKKFLGG
jgi:uncharacterized protein YidB (DUF937 family)